MWIVSLITLLISDTGLSDSPGHHNNNNNVSRGDHESTRQSNAFFMVNHDHLMESFLH